MCWLVRVVIKWSRAETAASLFEYALLLAAIALLCLGVMSALGNNISSLLVGLAGSI
jgi:Flp pilus assembly pilin Flp